MYFRLNTVTILGMAALATATQVLAKGGVHTGDGYDLIGAVSKLHESAIKPIDGIEDKVQSGELTPTEAATKVAMVAKEIMEQAMMLVKKHPTSAQKMKRKLFSLQDQYSTELKQVMAKIKEISQAK